MRTFMSRVEYNERGNASCLRSNVSKPTGRTEPAEADVSGSRPLRPALPCHVTGIQGLGVTG